MDGLIAKAASTDDPERVALYRDFQQIAAATCR